VPACGRAHYEPGRFETVQIARRADGLSWLGGRSLRGVPKRLAVPRLSASKPHEIAAAGNPSPGQPAVPSRHNPAAAPHRPPVHEDCTLHVWCFGDCFDVLCFAAAGGDPEAFPAADEVGEVPDVPVFPAADDVGDVVGGVLGVVNVPAATEGAT
jgi:hypothetical protein